MLEWTHDSETCPLATSSDPHAKLCTGGTDCEEFPTLQDRKNMASAAYQAYAEADGTDFWDFVRDVMILAYMDYSGYLSQNGSGRYAHGRLHSEVTIAYLLANGLTVPEDLALWL